MLESDNIFKTKLKAFLLTTCGVENMCLEETILTDWQDLHSEANDGEAGSEFKRPKRFVP